MHSNNDRVINVPIPDDDVVKNVTALPRTRQNDGYVVVNFKRKKSLKKTEMKQMLQPEKLLEGLEYLRKNHPDYKEIVPIDIIHEFLEMEEENDLPEITDNPDTGRTLLFHIYLFIFLSRNLFESQQR